uniref:G-protein coupled receptors family 2 profile 2 domain-containing protein n=1 Tax=Clytia hemisphaerica TaxID=252671 RepID=A0A7M5VD72_9CNID
MSLYLIVISMLLVWQEVSMQEDCRKWNITEIALTPNEKPFPLSDFLDASGINSSVIQWTGFQCQRWLQKGECRCNAGCQSSGDCCIDYLWNQFAFNNQSIAQNVNDYQQKVIKSSKSQHCLPLFPFEEEILEYYIMVDSCLPGANEIDIEHCMNSSSNEQVDQMPVLGNDKYLYKNKFCAYCNNVSNYDRDFVDVVCWVEKEINKYTAIELLKSNDCNTMVSNNVKSDSVFKCDKITCNQLDATLCRLVAANFELSENELVKNPFCSKCLNSLPSSVDVTSCSPGGTPGGQGQSWDRVIDLNDFKECGVNQEIRHGLHRYCERKLCGTGQALIDGKCGFCKELTKLQRNDGNENDICKCDFVTNKNGDCVCKEGWRPISWDDCACAYDRRLVQGECICHRGMEPQSDGRCRCSVDHVKSEGDGCICRPGMVSTSDGKCECTFDRERDRNGDCVCKEGWWPNWDDCVCAPGRRLVQGECICHQGMEPQSDGSCRCLEDQFGNSEGDGCICRPGMVSTSDGKCECPFDRERDRNGECVCKKGLLPRPDGTCFNVTRRKILDCPFPKFWTSDGKCDCPPWLHLNNGNCVCNAGTINSLERPSSCTCLLGHKNNGYCDCPSGSSRRKDSKDVCTCDSGFHSNLEENKCAPNKFQAFVTELRCITQLPRLTLYVFMNENSNSSIPAFFNLLKLKWILPKDLFVLQSTDFRNIPNWKEKLLQETQSNLNITKAVVTSHKNHLFTHLYGYDVIRTFDRFKLCAKYNKITIKPEQDCNQAIASMQESRNASVNTIITFEKGEIREEIYSCEQFHLHSTCGRENINPSNYNISSNGSLNIWNSERENLQSYSAGEYTPLERGFQICRVDNSEDYEFQQYSWVKPVDNAKSYISLIGTVLSLICYVIFLVVFAKVAAIRNRGAFCVMFLVIFLITSDILFLVTSYIETQSTTCKWFGMIFYWSMLNVLFWSVIVAIDITLQFTKKLSRPLSLHESISVLRKRSGITVFISLIILLAIIGLEESNTFDFHFENRCWFGDFYLSLGFYFIPAIIGYVLCFVCLCIVLASIRRRKSEVERTLNKDTKKDTDLLKIGIKLMLVLGITELFGLIQIKSDHLRENEEIFNSVFGLLYILLRAFRGVIIFIVYMVNRRTMKLLKEHFTKIFEHYELTVRTETSTVSNSI